MRFLRPPVTIDKSQSTLYSMSTSTMVSGSSSSNGSTNQTRTTANSDTNNNMDDEDDGIESLNRSTVCVNGDDDGSSSECSYNECDITLIDDDDLFCDAKTDGEMLYCQVVEMLRFEIEVCVSVVPDNHPDFLLSFTNIQNAFILTSHLSMFHHNLDD